ncbi:MAG: MFS transporter [Candidatus Tectomicrobia bacterium]|nr:MFS transporter [Candidatus Tectomicrobia bacterium]
MRKLYYGWIIVGVSFVCFALAVGARFSFSIFYVALLKDFGWSRGSTAGAYSLGMVVYALSSPLVGGLFDRFGPRGLFPLGALLLGLGLVLSSRIDAVWHLYVLQGFVIAFGISALGFGPNAAYIARWFRRRLGTANGIAIAGIGVGLLFLGPGIQWVIERYDWRTAYLLFGLLIPLLLVPLSLIFQRSRPEAMGLAVDGAPPAESPAASSSDIASPAGDASPPFASIARSRDFQLMFPVAMVIGFTNNLMMIHAVAHMVDVGYTPMLAATSLGLVNIMRTCGSLLGGYASDRVGRRRAYLLGSACSAAGVLLFMNIHLGITVLYAFLLCYGIGLGALSPIYGALISDIAPGRRLGFIMGLFEIVYGLSGAFGAWFAGMLFDRWRSYTVPFLIVLAAMGIACLCIVAMGRAPASSRGTAPAATPRSR